MYWSMCRFGIQQSIICIVLQLGDGQWRCYYYYYYYILIHVSFAFQAFCLLYMFHSMLAAMEDLMAAFVCSHWVEFSMWIQRFLFSDSFHHSEQWVVTNEGNSLFALKKFPRSIRRRWNCLCRWNASKCERGAFETTQQSIESRLFWTIVPEMFHFRHAHQWAKAISAQNFFLPCAQRCIVFA